MLQTKERLNPSDLRFKHMFLFGTALDPRYRVLLNLIQLSAAKDQLYKEVCRLLLYRPRWALVRISTCMCTGGH